jgi:hypothetical protein
LIAVIASTLALAPAGADVQKLAGAAFETFAAKTEAICPARHFRFVTPGDLDGYQEDFAATLTRRERARLAAANPSRRACTSGHGLSCPTVTLLGAMGTVGLLERFAAFACTDPPTVTRRYRGSSAHP